FPDWSFTASAVLSSGAWLQGDESNLNPKTGGYATFDLGASYKPTESVELFATVENLFDKQYATFGTFSPTDDVPLSEAPGASNPRSLSPSMPRAFFGGLRVSF